MSTGPFQMSSGAINSISFAIIHVPDVPHPCPSLEPLREACAIIEDLYNGEISKTKEILDKSLNISLKPNPFSNETQLIFPDLTNQVEIVQMYNLSGQLVREYKNITGDSLRITKNDLHSGIYFLKVQTRDHRFQSGKIVIQ